MTFWRPLTPSCMVGAEVSSLRHLSVVMVQPGQNRNRNHFASSGRSGTRCSSGVGDLLPNPLMRPCLVEIGDIRMEYTVELLLMQDEQIIEALTSHTAQAALTDGIG